MGDDEERQKTVGGASRVHSRRARSPRRALSHLMSVVLTLSFGSTARADEAPVLGKIMTYDDWTVGCDNGLVCRAISLIPEDEFELEGMARMTIVRAAGPEAQPE